MKTKLKSFVGLLIQKGPEPTYRAVEIRVELRSMIKEFGLWQVFWGTDIFIGRIPFMKLLVLANIIVWILTK